MCAHIRVRACVCARVCKRVPVCAGRGRPGAAGSEDAGWRGLNASGAASRVSRAPPGTRACGHVAVPPPPASQSPERGVCSPTGLVRRGVRRGGLGAGLRAWGRGVPPPRKVCPDRRGRTRGRSGALSAARTRLCGPLPPGEGHCQPREGARLWRWLAGLWRERRAARRSLSKCQFPEVQRIGCHFIP